MAGKERLAMIMRVQTVAFAAYGLTLFLIPEFTIDTVFGWESPALFWARAVGAAFIGIALLEWHIVSQLDTRMDLVWPFVVLPGLFVIGFLWSEFADELGAEDGHEAFYWVSFGVAAFFFVAVALARAGADR